MPRKRRVPRRLNTDATITDVVSEYVFVSAMTLGYVSVSAKTPGYVSVLVWTSAVCTGSVLGVTHRRYSSPCWSQMFV